MPQVPQTFREGCGEKPPTFFFDYSCNGVTGAVGALGRSEGDLRSALKRDRQGNDSDGDKERRRNARLQRNGQGDRC